MADLDPVVQEILLEGDGEILRALNEIGEKGSEALKELAEAFSGGNGAMEAFANSLGAAIGAVSAATAALSAFVEKQDEAIQRLDFLATAFGSTAEKVAGLEAAFAQAGVSTATFERFAQRLTTTIAQQWPQITASVRTAATQQSEAQEQIVAATLKVKSAQDAVAFGAEEDAQKTASANLRVQETYHALQNAAQEQASARVRSTQSVVAANNSLESAENRLRTLTGSPPSAAEAQGLQIREAELAVDQARQAQADALIAKQREAEEQADKMAQKQQAFAAAQLAAQKDAAGLTDAQRARENSLAEAIDHRAAAQERADKLALTSIPRISSALQGVVDKNTDLAKSVDLSQVSVRNLTNGVIELASKQNNNAKPTGIQVYTELSKVLSSTTDDLITKDQQLAVVQQLLSRGFGAGSHDAAELLNVLKQGTKATEDYDAASKRHISTQEGGIKAAEDFKKAFEGFNQVLDLTTRDLAVLVSPALIAFFETLKSSLSENEGLLHQFVDGITAIGRAIGAIIQTVTDLGHAIDKVFSFEAGTTFKIALIGLVTFVAAFASAWLAVPTAILLVITAVGALARNFDELKQKAADWASSFISPAVIQFCQTFIGYLQSIVDWFVKIKANAPKFLGGGGGEAPASAGVGNAAASQVGQNAGAEGNPDGLKFASGGHVRGEGTATSDSIFARLSDGEFVQRSAAVQHYGVDFMNAINNMSFPGFAAGGLVASPVRMGGGAGGSIPASSTLNLSIDGRSFNGLRGPKSTVDDLSSFAIARQTGSGGKRPSWQG